MHLGRVAVALGLVVTLAASSFAPAAFAADGDVYQAWVAHDSDFCTLGAKARKRRRAWDRSHSKKAEKRLLATLGATRDVIKQVIADVAAQATSTNPGMRGKTYAQRSNRQLDAAVHESAQAVRAGTPNPGPATAAHDDAANRHFAKSAKNERIARRAFKKAGVIIKENPNGCAS